MIRPPFSYIEIRQALADVLDLAPSAEDIANSKRATMPGVDSSLGLLIEPSKIDEDLDC